MVWYNELRSGFQDLESSPQELRSVPQANTDKERAFAAARTFKQYSTPAAVVHSTVPVASPPSSSDVGTRMLRAGTTVEMACL